MGSGSGGAAAATVTATGAMKGTAAELRPREKLVGSLRGSPGVLGFGVAGSWVMFACGAAAVMEGGVEEELRRRRKLRRSFEWMLRLAIYRIYIYIYLYISWELFDQWWQIKFGTSVYIYIERRKRSQLSQLIIHC